MPSLSRVEAVERARILRVDGYDIDLDLTAEGDRFGSTTTIRFGCREPGATTFVELKPAELLAATLNGRSLDPASLQDNRLQLTDLAADNELTVRAAMEYSRTGEGLHRFVDPEDGQTYCYAQAFLDDAERIFACFDQPDLKGRVSLRVVAPPEWEVAANGAGTRTGSGEWTFARTVPLSTYLVSLLAGPYHVRREVHDGIPLAVYCRRALAPHLDKDIEEIFDVTRQCFDRYHELFGVRYPFGKYDQAFVPEFNAGAMENPGLVTIRDEFLFRSAVTEYEREQRATGIAHEMAHMWFGDLVTMAWWDDLWLNESFAEYMGVRVTAEATKFTNAWTGFAVGRKGWGYAADQRPSTHPVAPESVVDTAHALLNFDGISYAKGASALRQLVAWLGDGAFMAGIRAYFDAHAYGNATLDDLLAALGAAAGRDLSDWAAVWLRQPEVNTLRPEVARYEGTFDTVHIVQSAPASHPVLRPHRIGVGIYDGGVLLHRVQVDLEPDSDGGRTAVPDLTGLSTGDLLLVNDGDLTYAKIRFDPEDQARLRANLPSLVDPIARALVWAASLDAVRDGDLPPWELVELLAAGLPGETDVAIVRDLVRFVTSRAADAPFLPGGMLGRYLPPPRVAAAEERVAAAFRASLESAPAGLALGVARGYIGTCRDPDELLAWLGNGAPAGLEMDAELRWAVLARLAALGSIDASSIEDEADRDRTASGAVHAARCRASRPDPAAKEAAWTTILADTSLSNRLVNAAAEGFWHPGQGEVTHSYVERYFAEIPTLPARRTPAMVMWLATSAYPRYSATPETVALAEDLLDRGDLDPVLRRVVEDGTDEIRRGVAGRRLTERTAS